MQHSDVLLKPVLTEKSTNLKEQGFYSFIVNRSANKIQVKKAVENLFKVNVLDCKVVNVKPKFKALRTTRGYGKTNNYKKALVKLAKDQKIGELDV